MGSLLSSMDLCGEFGAMSVDCCMEALRDSHVRRALLALWGGHDRSQIPETQKAGGNREKRTIQ